MPPSDDPKISTELLLQLHAGLEVLKSRQSEINRRLGKLEAAMEEAAKDEAEEDKAPIKWLDYFWQGIVWAAAMTLAVTVGRMFGLEVAF